MMIIKVRTRSLVKRKKGCPGAAFPLRAGWGRLSGRAREGTAPGLAVAGSSEVRERNAGRDLERVSVQRSLLPRVRFAFQLRRLLATRGDGHHVRTRGDEMLRCFRSCAVRRETSFVTLFWLCVDEPPSQGQRRPFAYVFSEPRPPKRKVPLPAVCLYGGRVGWGGGLITKGQPGTATAGGWATGRPCLLARCQQRERIPSAPEQGIA